MLGHAVLVTIEIHRIPDGAGADAQPLLRAFSVLEHVIELHRLGNTDLCTTYEGLVASAVESRYSRVNRWVALPAGVDPRTAGPDEAVGMLATEYSLVDNTNLVMVWIGVRPELRGRGIARALEQVAREDVAASGRSIVQVWTDHELYSGQDALRPRTGAGAVNPDSVVVRYLLARGFAFEQAEVHNMLTVPAAGQARQDWREEIRRLGSAAHDASGADYQLVQWADATPEPALDDYAQLRTRMSVDIPSAELAFEEQKWDADRIRDMDERRVAAGRAHVVTAARHVPSGRLVAYSELVWQTQRPDGVWQWDTFVHGEHRGHRLGLLVKAANLTALVEHNPLAARIHTWNAGENSYMLSINNQLGFVPRGVAGGWQRTVS